MAVAKRKKPRPRRRHRFHGRDIARYYWEDVFHSTLRCLVEAGKLNAPASQAADIADTALAEWRQRYPNAE